MAAILTALRRVGIQPVENSQDCEAALIWSVLWAGRMAGNRTVYEHYRSLDRPVIVIDIGALYRGQTWKIAINHVNGLGYHGHLDDLDFDRPKKLKVSLKKPQIRSDHILIALQNQNSLQWQGQPPLAIWAKKQIDLLRQHTDRPIKIRPHPRCPVHLLENLVDAQIQIPRHNKNTYDEFDIDLTCHAVVNHNSGPGIQSAISQIPVIVDQSSLAWPVSISMHDIENPPKHDYERWLIEICHTEYTVEEITQGMWLSRLASRL